MSGAPYEGVSIDEVELTVARCTATELGRSSADVVLLSAMTVQPKVLLVKRRKAPFSGLMALPGGHAEGAELSRAAAVRELNEETGVAIDPSLLRHVGTYAGADRDPRHQARSEVFVASLDVAPAALAGSDAASVAWIDIEDCALGKVELAFDHARILGDSLTMLDPDNPYSGRLKEIASRADERNEDFASRVRSRIFKVDQEVLLAEYAQKSNEIVERIKQRDSFINLNIVAAALIVGFAGSDPSRAAAWLALPWSSLCFGWAYLANDEKVTGLARYFKHHTGPQLGVRALGWERSPKRGTKLKRLHKSVQLIVDLLQFVAPTAAALVAYGSIAIDPWTAPMLTLVVFEACLAAAMAALIVAHSSFIERFDVPSADWSQL